MLKRNWSFVLLCLAVIVALTGFMYRFSLQHVIHYTGDTSRTERKCLTCHLYANGGTFLDRILQPHYLTPLDIAVSQSGDRLFVTARDVDQLLELDPHQRRVLRRIPVGRRPHSVVLNPQGTRAYVTNQYANEVAVVDIARGETVAVLPVGMAPTGLALDAKGGRLVVANWLGNDISVVGISPSYQVAGEFARFEGGMNPISVAISADGKRVLVTNQLSFPVSYPGIPVSEITMINLSTHRVEKRFQIPNGHMLDGIAFTPSGKYALAVLVQPKNLLPALQVERGWMMVNAIAVIDFEESRVWQFPLDDVDRFFADPADIVIDPQGRYAFVSHGGVDYVSVVDLPELLALVRTSTDEELTAYSNDLGISQRYIRKRIPVGSNPRGLAISPDGGTVYVAERLDDRIGIIDVDQLQRTGEIDLGGPQHLTVVRKGAKVFHSAGNTLQGQFSCRSCHPDQHVDRLQYDFEPNGLGKNILDNRSLRGLRGTAPFKWNGKNTSLYMQCGIRFARILTRSEPFTPQQLNSLVAFISSREAFPNPYRPGSNALIPSQVRGKEIFERAVMLDGKPISEQNRCITCHPPPFFTNLMRADVNTQFTDDSSAVFDVPHLNNIWMSAPYLHHGKAKTLEEIWTLFSLDDTHGAVSDLGKEGLNDLIEYLKTL